LSYSVSQEDTQPIFIAVPALVSADDFAAVAEQLAENRRRARCRREGARYLLQGLVVCRRCGYAWHGLSRQGPQRRHAYYRCGGREVARAQGEEPCGVRPVRAEDLEGAVWRDVCALLNDPQKVAAEYQRRLQGEEGSTDRRGAEPLAKVIAKVKRTIGRLIDAYSEGLLEKEEFEPRLRAAKERLGRLEAEAAAAADEEVQQAELRLVIGKLEEFAEKVRDGLAEAAWATRREIIRALVKRVEVDEEEVRIVYRVAPFPFVKAPEGGVLQDCWKRGHRFAPRFAPSRTATPSGRSGTSTGWLPCGRKTGPSPPAAAGSSRSPAAATRPTWPTPQRAAWLRPRRCYPTGCGPPLRTTRRPAARKGPFGTWTGPSG